jgi:large subunit ribosomal protein L33
MADSKKSKDARRHVALECTECKEKNKVSHENYFVEKNTKNTTDRLELNKYCPFCKKTTLHKEKK